MEYALARRETSQISQIDRLKMLLCNMRNFRGSHQMSSAIFTSKEAGAEDWDKIDLEIGEEFMEPLAEAYENMLINKIKEAEELAGVK